jgi:uncharacterized protein HemX
MIDKPDSNEEEILATATEEKKTVRSKRNQGVRFALFMSLLALFFTAAGIASGYKHWQRMNDRARANQSEIDVLRHQLQETPKLEALEKLRLEVTGKSTQSEEANAKAVQEMARLQSETRQFADTVASQVEQVTLLQARAQQNASPASAKDWQIAEVEFLLQLANRELYLAQNTRTASAALKEADALLAKIGVVSYLPVRQQITRDLTTLESFSATDIGAISQRISAMMLALKPLSPLMPTPESSKTVPLTEGGDSVAGNSLWADYKRKALDALNQAVVVSQLDKPVQAELDADARMSLYQLLHLRLETLRLMVLQRMDTGYHEQIKLLRETVQSYYPEAQAKSLLTELDELDKYNLQPALPDISGSLKQLESARHAEVTEKPASPSKDAAEERDAPEKATSKGGKHK